MTRWINNRYGIQLKENDLKSVRDFSLIWNIFEGTVCNNSFSITRVEQAIRNRDFSLDEFAPILDYFRDRYVSNNQTNQRFEQLHFRENDRKDFVADVLLGNHTGTKQIILALVIIVYRFRNNLFHGLKDVRFIGEQESNFDNANRVLTTILNHF